MTHSVIYLDIFLYNSQNKGVLQILPILINSARLINSANINIIHCFMNILLIIDCGGMGVQGPKCNNVISTTEPM